MRSIQVAKVEKRLVTLRDSREMPCWSYYTATGNRLFVLEDTVTPTDIQHFYTCIPYSL